MLPSESPNARRRLDSLIRLYELADNRLSAMVANALLHGTVAKLKYRRRVLAQVQALLVELHREGEQAAEQVVVSAYDDGLRIAHPDQGRRAIKGALGGGPHRQAIDVLVNSLENGLTDAEQTVGRRIDDIFRREQLRAVAEQLAVGNIKSDAAAALETALRRQGTTAFVDKAGRSWSLDTYTAMAARTVQREAMSTATKNRMVERGIDLVEIDRHPHVPDLCSPYDGKTFSLTGATPGYDKLDKIPPFHPNCRHTMFPSPENFRGQRAA